MIEPFLDYIRTLHFVAPQTARRYYRIFGDLDYDLLSLRVEIEVMHQRLREVKRRVAAAVPLATGDEQRISANSVEINEYLYGRLERLQARIADARRFRYDHERERHGLLLLSDIAIAVLGLRDESVRAAHAGQLDEAVRAYADGDLPGLADAHERVQSLLAMERRDELTAAERAHWRRRLHAILLSHPMSRKAMLASPEGIHDRVETLRRRIERAQEQLEMLGARYTAIVRALRFSN